MLLSSSKSVCASSPTLSVYISSWSPSSHFLLSESSLAEGFWLLLIFETFNSTCGSCSFLFFLRLGLQTALFSYQSLKTKGKRQSQWEKLFCVLFYYLSVCSFSSNDQIPLRCPVCGEIDLWSLHFFLHFVANNANFGELHGKRELQRKISPRRSEQSSFFQRVHRSICVRSIEWWRFEWDWGIAE